MKKKVEEDLLTMAAEAMPARRPRSGRNVRRPELVESSLRAHSYGMTALIPFAGLIYGPMAFYAYAKSRLLAASGWNPGRGQAIIGGVFGFLGFAASIGWLALVIY